MASAPAFQIKLIGASDVRASLKELPERLAKNVLSRALMRSAIPVRDDAISRIERHGAPPDTKDKIVISAQLSKRQRKGARRDGKYQRTVYVGVAPSPVAHLIELGTGPRFTKKGVYRGRMLPRPFLRPAWDSNKHEVLDGFVAILKQEIEATAKRLARRQIARMNRVARTGRV